MQGWELRKRDVSSLDRPWEGPAEVIKLESSVLKNLMGSKDKG